MKNLILLHLFLLTFLSSLLFISCEEKQVYIVYLGEHNGDKTHQEIEQTHHSYLSSLKKTEEAAKASLLYSYKNSINGFAALLTPEEASLLSSESEVVSVFASKPHTWSLQTTRSWKFVGLEEDGQREEKGDGERRGDLLHRAKFGKDIIVGLLDSGVWPESRSFNDEDMGPVPKSWRGICQAGDSFDSSHCNSKSCSYTSACSESTTVCVWINWFDQAKGPPVQSNHRSTLNLDWGGKHRSTLNLDWGKHSLRTLDHVSRFVKACNKLQSIKHKERLTRVETFDIGIDSDRFIRALKLPDVQYEIKGFCTCFENKVCSGCKRF